jgi:hypothetical protein
MADDTAHKLAATVAARRRQLDETFSDEIRALRKRHGNATVLRERNAFRRSIPSPSSSASAT